MPHGDVKIFNTLLSFKRRTSLVLEARTATLTAREDPAPFFVALARAIPDVFNAQVIMVIPLFDEICKIRSLRC